jgi:phosphatidylglycerophosphate synthase
MVRRIVAIGSVAQAVVLGSLAVSVGMTAFGWAVGLTCGAIGSVLLGRAVQRSGARDLGAANVVTSVRAVLVGGVTALVASSFVHPVAVPPLVLLASVALALDAVDGRVARRTGTVTAVGARFDMEVDAFLILVLCIAVARPLGLWVLGIGLARYTLLVTTRMLPWLGQPIPASLWRKSVAAIQGVVLTTAATGVLPPVAATVLVGVAAMLLAGSFGGQVVWLARLHRGATHPSPSLAVAPAHG